MQTKPVIHSTHAGQAIVTRYHGPTNTRGSRISATACGGRVVVPYDYAGEVFDNHAAAAMALAAKLNWGGEWAGGVLPSGDYAFTMLDK